LNRTAGFLSEFFPPAAPVVNIVMRGARGVKKTEKTFYTTKELAVLLNMSVRWVVVHRHEIAGRCRMGRLWRFDKAIIDARRAKGKVFWKIDRAVYAYIYLQACMARCR